MRNTVRRVAMGIAGYITLAWLAHGREVWCEEAAPSASTALQDSTVQAPALPHADDAKAWEAVYKMGKVLKFETVWFLHYRYGYQAKSGGGYVYASSFNIGRGYLTMKVTPAAWFEGRITLDSSQDATGDFKIRLKYLYGLFKLPVETAAITEPGIEFGMVHMPWLDYEEHVNWYRMQGTMFMERNKLFDSADLGITAFALLGKKLPGKYQDEVSGKYPGTWGSISLGVYNGGGYHAIENNAGKSFEGRISVRPLGPVFPNLQLSYFVIAGRGNMAGTRSYKAPEWISHAIMASLEHRCFVVTGQYVIGTGNQKGDFVDLETDPATGETTGVAHVHEYQGASGFLEIKLPWILSSIIGRYDWFDRQKADRQWSASHRIVAGWAVHFFGGFHKNVILVDLDYLISERQMDTWEAKLTLQVSL